jgi:signal transduction histidine kinase
MDMPSSQIITPDLEVCLDALAQHVLLLDGEGRIVFANRAWREFARPMFRDAYEWVGRPYIEVFLEGTRLHPGVKAHTIDQIRALLAGTVKRMTSEIALMRDDGRYWFTVHAESLPDGVTVVSHYDITEILALDEARTRFATLANDSSEYVLIFDPGGKADYANVAARRLAHRLVAEIAPECAEPELERWRAVLSAAGALRKVQLGGVWRGELALPTNDARDLIVSATMQAHATDDGGTVYYSAVMNDISADKKREEELHNRHVELELAYSRLKDTQDQLLQSEKMASIGQLAAGVAHEINNPIGYVHSNLGSLNDYTRDLFSLIEGYEAALRGAGELPPGIAQRLTELRQRYDLDFVARDLPQLLAESREGIDRVKKIVQDLKDFSHVGTSEEWVMADLHKGLDSTLNIVWSEVKYKAEVHKHYGELPLVECLPMQLNQVFMNLLVNAAQAMPKRGNITIRSGVDGECVWLSIADDGEGIPEALMQRIFDPFFTTKPVGKGTGLGLSLSYGIVKKHQGRIEVKSRAGEGAEFRITLPIVQARSQAPANS